MKYIIILCLVILTSLLSVKLSVSQDVIRPKPLRPNPEITVIGNVYCDYCSNNSFSTHSYFLPGVEVKIDCKFQARAEKTSEEITFSVKRTTNRFGWYKLQIPSVDGIECANNDSSISSICRASLEGGTSSSSSKCNVPGYKTTTDLVFFRSRETNVCIYGLSALNFRPTRKNRALCGN